MVSPERSFLRVPRNKEAAGWLQRHYEPQICSACAPAVPSPSSLQKKKVKTSTPTCLNDLKQTLFTHISSFLHVFGQGRHTAWMLGCTQTDRKKRTAREFDHFKCVVIENYFSFEHKNNARKTTCFFFQQNNHRKIANLGYFLPVFFECGMLFLAVFC